MSTAMHPRFTPFLSGFEEQTTLLKSAFKQQRFPHALLLTGPKGVGKATFSYHIARALLSGDFEAFDLSPKTPLFQRVAAEAHGDLFVLERDLQGQNKRDISVQDVRQTVSFLQKTAFEGGWRIAIVDSVNELNKNAANALLKSLEEPPEKTLLILIHHGSGGILPTLRSRCQRLECSSHTESSTQEILERFLSPLSPVDLKLFKCFANGAPGTAIRLKIAHGDLFQAYVELLKNLSQQRFSSAFHFVEKYLLKKMDDKVDDPFDVFRLLFDWGLSRLVSVATNSLQEEAYQGEIEHLTKLLEIVPLAKLPGIWAKGHKLLRDARIYNFDTKHTFICIFSEFTANSKAI